MCLGDECFGEQQADVQMERMLLVFRNCGVVKSVTGCHRGTGECPSVVMHDTCRKVKHRFMMRRDLLPPSSGLLGP